MAMRKSDVGVEQPKKHKDRQRTRLSRGRRIEQEEAHAMLDACRSMAGVTSTAAVAAAAAT